MKLKDIKTVNYKDSKTYSQIKEEAIKAGIENNERHIYQYWKSKGYIRAQVQFNGKRTYIYYLP